MTRLISKFASQGWQRFSALMFPRSYCLTCTEWWALIHGASSAAHMALLQGTEASLSQKPDPVHWGLLLAQ